LTFVDFRSEVELPYIRTL